MNLSEALDISGPEFAPLAEGDPLRHRLDEIGQEESQRRYVHIGLGRLLTPLGERPAQLRGQARPRRQPGPEEVAPVLGEHGGEGAQKQLVVRLGLLFIVQLQEPVEDCSCSCLHYCRT